MARARKKRPKRRTSPTHPRPVSSTPDGDAKNQPRGLSKAPRSAAIDALRGFAVVQMIVDHTASNVFAVPIAMDTVRFPTRLAMPLFAILLGYFLPVGGRFRTRRLVEIFVASVAVNLLYFPRHDDLEILASLLIAAIVGTTLRAAAPAMLGLFLFYQTDPLLGWFDYQLSIVLPIVAVGSILRRFGLAASLAAVSVLLVMTLSGKWIYPSDTHRFLIWMSPLALGLIELGRRMWKANPRLPKANPRTSKANPRKPDDPPRSRVLLERIRGLLGQIGWLKLDLLGRYPLTIYVGHYYVLYAVAYFVQQ
ncbi:MAG: TraX family protein [Planctomycetota bacterium]